MLVLERPESRGAEIEIIALWLGLGSVLLAWTFPLWGEFYPLACPLKSMTGIPCAFCGGTRAAHAWAHGHLLEAWLMNPLVTVGAALATLYLPYALFCVLVRPARRLRLTGLRQTASPVMRWCIRIALAFAVLANWGYLIAVGR